MAASELLATTLERGIAKSSNIISNAMVSNHTSQLNNFARCAEVLCKRISEYDGPEALATTENYTRYSPASQVHSTAIGMAELGTVLQNNQNQFAQGFLQLQQSIDALRSAILSKS